MKTIYELFSNLHTKEIDTVLNEFGINVPHDFSFSKTSIIIGINGSGKTRFLKAIKKLCLLNKERVIYL